MEALAKLKPIVRPGGTVTAGNASGVNDGAQALIVASARGRRAPRADADRAHRRHGDRRRAAARHGHRPGAGDAEAARAARHEDGRLRSSSSTKPSPARRWRACASSELADDAEHVNPNGGAIAYGHPLGMSGARLAADVALELQRAGGRFGLATMCVGVGQGVAMALERR